MSPLIIENLVKRYAGRGLSPVLAVDDVSFSLRSGEVFGLLGPNGAGKTSIISMIVTLEKPTQGRILVNGFDNQVEPRLAKQYVGFVPQEIINHGYFTVEEILHFHSGFYGLKHNKKRVEFLLGELRLDEHRHKKVKQLSGGMKRRLLIAKSLVHSPRLLLLDEPTAGVDIELRTQLWQFVKGLKQEGVTVLLTTHYLEEAQLLCDRVGVLDRGKLKTVGETSSIIRDFTQRKVRITSRSAPMIQEFDLPAGTAIGDLLASRSVRLEDIEDISVLEGTLEDAFRRIVYKERIQ